MKRTTWRRPARGLGLAALAAVAFIAPSVPARAASRTPAVTAGDLGYPYPNAPDCDEQTGANCVADQWGFVQGQCHSWVAYRLNELNATELGGETFDDTYHMPAGDEWGSVWRWDTAAQEAGVTMDDSPTLGSVAWWSADGGHVAYVEAVNGDGSIQISEMNADFHNGFDFATLTPSGRWPDKFIHIADRPPARTPTSFSIAVNGGSSASVARGDAVTLSESGISTHAQGTVTFSTAGIADLCIATLPATSCDADNGLAEGSYGPVHAAFVDTDGAYTNASASNTVSFTVGAAPTSFSIAVNGGASASVVARRRGHTVGVGHLDARARHGHVLDDGKPEPVYRGAARDELQRRRRPAGRLLRSGARGVRRHRRFVYERVGVEHGVVHRGRRADVVLDRGERRHERVGRARRRGHVFRIGSPG